MDVCGKGHDLCDEDLFSTRRTQNTTHTYTQTHTRTLTYSIVRNCINFGDLYQKKNFLFILDSFPKWLHVFKSPP